jgi:endogenous inhibitor of DNA gyrase (YacG/DUF329 family)
MSAEPVCCVCKTPIERPPRGTLGDFPFCSPRCRALDLSNWLDDRYAVTDPPLFDGLELDTDLS